VPAGGVTPCGASLAIFDTSAGTAWAIRNLDNGSLTCDSAGTNAFGRWVKMTKTPSSHPIISISRQQAAAPVRSINVQECTNPTANCTVPSAKILTSLSSEGRWHALEVDADSSVNLAAYVDDDGTGKKGVQFLNAAGSLLGAITTTNIGFSTNDTGRFVTMASTGTAVAQAGNEFSTPGTTFVQGGLVLGWQFSVSAATRVSSLGVYANLGGALGESHLVTLWSDTGPTPLASATVPAGTAAPLINHFRYVPIQPIVLSPGTYTIGAQYASALDAIVPTGSTGIVQAPGVSWTQARFAFPSGYPGTVATGFASGYYGANFQSTPAAAAPLIRSIAFRDSTSFVARYAACQIDSTAGCPLASPQLIADPAGSTNYGLGATMVRDATGGVRLAYFDAVNSKARLLTGSTAGSFQLQAEFPSGSPSGLSMVFGGGIFLGYSQTNTGPLGFFSGL